MLTHFVFSPVPVFSDMGNPGSILLISVLN
jgi:hypothetical protein